MMMKISSISSHCSHPMLSSVSVDGLTTEIRAMDNERVDSSERNNHVVLTSSRQEKETHPRESCSASGPTEPPSKRIKTELPDHPGVDQVGSCDTEQSEQSAAPVVDLPSAAVISELKQTHHRVAPLKANLGGSSIVTSSSSGASHSSASNTSLHETAGQATLPVPNPTAQAACAPVVAAAPPSSKAPLNAKTMDHLRTKYLGELEYMLREFRRLERQLLGAKGAAQLEESVGSRERREKLHSFILHLEDTVRQIEVGCAREDQEKGSTVSALEQRGDIATSNSTKEIEDVENVQKLEEHILANLLPVKTRLKKQLAAQQGATRNPPGMPAPRRGSLQPSSAALGKGTFAAAAEERRKQAEAARLEAQQEEEASKKLNDPTLFGKPLGSGGSSLTQKLHGATLGSSQRIHGHGVGSIAPTSPVDDAKILYAGMVPQSKQHQSSLNAAGGVHNLVVEDPNFLENPNPDETDIIHVAAPTTALCATVVSGPQTKVNPDEASPQTKDPPNTVPALMPETFEKRIRPHEDITLSEEERRRLRKKRRKRKLLRIARRRERERHRQLALHQQAQAAQGSVKSAAGKKKTVSTKPQGKKKGPTPVEYMCALCSEAYSSTCDYNPWWALAQHECPKCRKMQIPRIDISSPANAIDYHPALLAHADENNGGGCCASGGVSGAATSVSVVHIAHSPSSHKSQSIHDQIQFEDMDSDSESDLSELSDGSLSDDSMDSDDSSIDFQLMSHAEQAEHECFGHDYEGPVLSDDDASRLLVLMAHASTCPCMHKLTKHRDVCMGTKFLMLHVRDCPGTTASLDVCPFPWCRKVKHLLYHLVSCDDPPSCAICSPKKLSDSLKGLVGLNQYRLIKHRQRLIATAKASNSARSKTVPIPSIRSPAQATRNSPDMAKAATTKVNSSAGQQQEMTATKLPAVILARQMAAAPLVHAVQPPLTEPYVTAPHVTKQPESQNFQHIQSSLTATTIQADLVLSFEEAERVEESTMVKAEPEEETSPAVITSELQRPFVETPLQQDFPSAITTPVLPESPTLDSTTQVQLKEEFVTVELAELPASLAAAPAETPVAMKMNVPRGEFDPSTATSATFTETPAVIDPPAQSTLERNVTSDSSPTAEQERGGDIVLTCASNLLEVAPAGAPSGTTTLVAELSAIKEEPTCPVKVREKALPCAQPCSCPAGVLRECIYPNDPATGEATSSMDTEDTIDKNAITGPIQAQLAPSEVLEVGC